MAFQKKINYHATFTYIFKGLFTNYVSKKWGSPDPPSPLCQPMSEFAKPLSSHLVSFISISLTFLSNDQKHNKKKTKIHQSYLFSRWALKYICFCPFLKHFCQCCHNCWSELPPSLVSQFQHLPDPPPPFVSQWQYLPSPLNHFDCWHN